MQLSGLQERGLAPVATARRESGRIAPFLHSVRCSTSPLKLKPLVQVSRLKASSSLQERGGARTRRPLLCQVPPNDLLESVGLKVYRGGLCSFYFHLFRTLRRHPVLRLVCESAESGFSRYRGGSREPLHLSLLQVKFLVQNSVVDNKAVCFLPGILLSVSCVRLTTRPQVLVSDVAPPSEALMLLTGHDYSPHPLLVLQKLSNIGCSCGRSTMT